MQDYRVYLLDQEGRITWADWIKAADLEAAIASVDDQHTSLCEIWQGATRLAIVPAKEQTGAASAR